MGDFNAVRYPDERRNSNFDQVSASDLNDFIYNADLSEFPMKGRKYTYAMKNGRKLSRLDRILVDHDFINNWPDSSFTALPRYLSDHSPLILISNPQDYGPIPFRFFNSWLSRPDLVNVILEANEKFIFNGPTELAFQAKLKFFREEIKKWVTANKAKEDEIKNCLTHELEELDKTMEDRLLSEEEEWILGECNNNLAELESHNLRDLWQKSRVSWASYGDDNTKYFHGVINSKNSKNRIHGIDINGSWIQKPKIVKREFRRFFQKRFMEEGQDRPSFQCPHLNRVSETDCNMLIKSFEE